MQNDRQREIDDIFLAAIDVAPEKRSSFVREQFAHVEPGVLHEVELLLEADEEATTARISANPHLNVAQLFPSTEHVGMGGAGNRIGNYHLLQKLGEGGMGVVYMAEQKQPVKRRVAFKVIKPGMDSKQVVARFEAERQALAMMDHPNIAKVLDVGTTELGRPYFVMELVKGVRITQYCDENRLGVKDRLRLFMSVCQAVQHAHQKGVIHRDLKPSNILVAEYDDIAVPKVIDFGLAKALQQALTEKTLFTQFGQIVGTFEYMSPEQARLNQLDIDTRTDIYSLGVLLYELLTGSTPFDSTTLRQAAFDEMLRMIREVEPPRPSTRLTGDKESSVAAASCRTEPKKLRSLLRGDLDAVVMRALDKDRARRYETSAALADDVERFMLGERVYASPPSSIDFVARFVRRNGAKLLKVGAVALLLLIAIVSIGLNVHYSYTTKRSELVRSLFRVKATEVPNVLKKLAQEDALNDSRIQERYSDSQLDSPGKLRAAIALLRSDESVVPYLAQRLMDTDPEEFLLVRNALNSHGNTDSLGLWVKAKNSDAEPGERFRAVCALATFDDASESWSDPDLTSDMATYLVSMPDFLKWHPFLHPVSEHLTEPLSEIFRESSDRRYTHAAAAVLSDILAEDVETLFELLAEAKTPQLFAAMFPSLERFSNQLIELAKREATQPLPAAIDPAAHEAVARRKANAAVALLKLGEFDEFWPLFRQTPDPTIRSFIIHRLNDNFDRPQQVVNWYQSEADDSIKSAMLFILGEFDQRRLAVIDRPTLVTQLVNEFKSESDPGLHGAIEWLLRKWGQNSLITQATGELAADASSPSPGNLEWYVNSLGQTFVILPSEAPLSGTANDNERQISTRWIAISTKEITKAQFLEFDSEVDAEFDMDFFPDPDCPMGYVSWYRAAAYCNWLSEQDGIQQDQWCFETNEQGKYAEGMKAKPNYLELTGYRLPTVIEWQYACRAGTETSRYYGEGKSLLQHYAWFARNSAYPTPASDRTASRPVGMLKPNDFGLFDMYGNIYEWCLNKFLKGTGETGGNFPEVFEIRDTPRRVLRGGAFPLDYDPVDSHYPGRRYLDLNSALHGLRPVRTIRANRDE